jgi:citrate lyase subunit beta / citryl-CoA lyase
MNAVKSTWRPRRSVLFLPASNLRAIEKARKLACDCIIFDLEDSVAPNARQRAHENLINHVAGQDYGIRECIIRVSQIGSDAHASDLDIALRCAPDAILLPKIETAARLMDTRKKIGPKGPPLWAMIETPLGVLDCREIGANHTNTNLTGLVLGPNDLSRATGTAMLAGRAAMLPWFMHVLAVARAFNLTVLDGVYNNFRDIEGFATECRQAAELGFDGKTLIHPDQIDKANTAFSPDEKTLDRARRIVEAFNLPENHDRGVIRIDGEMVERLHLAMARQLLARFGKS